jgi:phage regulator Rha-like protein
MPTKTTTKKPVTALVRKLPVPPGMIERRIYVLRGQKIMIDSDLAELYRVSTANLNKAVRRNLTRFPEDFMFQLTAEEEKSLRFQIGISKAEGRGGRRYRSNAFTEHGVVMLSSVLKSERAVQMNLLIVRVFVRLREMLATHKELADKMLELERQQREHGHQIAAVYTIVKRLMEPPRKRKRIIGFGVAAN